MDFDRLIRWITLLSIFAMAARISMDTDTWWHIRAGELIFQTKSILTIDPFSYTRYGESWLYPGWLFELPMYWIYCYFGPGGLNVLTASIVCLAFVFLWYAIDANAFLKGFVLILSATASGVYWSARPHLITLLFSAIFITLFERQKNRSTPSGRWTYISLPLLMIIWSNSHGGFIIGFVIWGVYAVDAFLSWYIKRDEKPNLRKHIYMGGCLLIAACINPAGVRRLMYPFYTVNIDALQAYIQEWQSPNFHDLSVQPFAWLILTTIIVLGFSKTRASLTDILLITGFGFMGLLAGRNIPLFALAAAIVIIRHLEGELVRFDWYKRLSNSRLNRQQNLINWFIGAIVCFAVLLKVITVYPAEVNKRAFEEFLPINAVEHIKSVMYPGKLYNSYNWGGYLLWALREYPVFIDGRTDLYNDEIVEQWLQVRRAEPEWQSVLDDWDINLMLIESNLPAVQVFVLHGWNIVYEDSLAVVLVRE